MLRNMVTSLFQHEQLETTDARAKELRSVAEKMITLAKRGDLHARRQALAFVRDKAVTHKLFEELKDRYLDRQGGYVRTIKKGNRRGDGAPISVIQLVPADEGKKKARKKSKAAVSGGPSDLKGKKKAKVAEKKKAPIRKKKTKKEVKGAEETSIDTKKKESD
jgi:large subunit ribosomal protein L17